MEAVGAGASIVTFVTVALGTLKLLSETLASVKDGPSNVQNAAKTILQLRSLLEHIQRSPQSLADDALHNDLRSCVSDLDVFAAQVVPLQTVSRETAGGRLWKRFRAFVSEKDLDQMSTAISRHSSRLTLRLSLGTSKTVSELKDDVALSTDAIRSLERVCQEQIASGSARSLLLQKAMETRHDAQLSSIQDSRVAIQASREDMVVRMDAHGSQLSEATSSIDNMRREFTTRLDSHEATMKDQISAVQGTLKGLEPSAISNSQANAMQETLAQILQHLRLGSVPSLGEQSRVVEEISDSKPEHSLESHESEVYATETDQRLIDSIKRIGELVTAKEETFDNFAGENQECEDVLESLGIILGEAKLRSGRNHDQLCFKHKSDAIEMTRGLRQFNKGFALNRFTINPQHQSFRTGEKKKLAALERVSSFHELDLGIGILTMKRKKIVQTCSCNDTSCLLCRSLKTEKLQNFRQKTSKTEVTTVVTFMPSDIRKYRMFVASDFVSRFNQCGNIFSISHLAVNRVFPKGSKVFQVVSKGNLEELREMLVEREALLRDHDEDGNSLLFYAILQPSVCRFLLDNGLEVDHVGKEWGFEKTALNSYSPGWDETQDDSNRWALCRDMLLEAGADPLFSPKPDGSGTFLGYNAQISSTMGFAESVHKAISSGSISLHDVLNYRYHGDSLLHIACRNFDDGSTKEHISQYLTLGFNLNDIDSAHGRTSLHIFISEAGLPYDIDDEPWILREQQVVTFLLQSGANPWATDWAGTSVSDTAYNRGAGRMTNKGSYRGDLWDSCLAIEGYDLSKFRTGWPRKGEYTKQYTRDDFELLWRGRESLCPYWNDWYVDIAYDGDIEA